MKFKWLLLTFLLFGKLYAQYEYKPGYIIKNDGETEEGLIYFKGNEFNAKKCQFKKNADSAKIIFSPEDIKAYRFYNSKYFESKKVPVENDEILLFLECLISGKSTIYYTQVNSRDYYFIHIGEEFLPIDNNEVIKEKNGFEYLVPSNQYKRVLKYCFRDCPPVVQKLDHSDFSKKSLINLSKEYHEYICKDEQCVIYEKQIHKRRFYLGFDLSYGISKLEFLDSHLEISLEPKNQFQFGILSQINLSEEGTFNLQGALRFFSYKNEILNDLDYSVGTYPSDLYYRFSILKPEIQLKYKKKFGNLVPFVSAGAFTNLFLVDKGYIYNERFDIRIDFNSGGLMDITKGHMEMIGCVGELGLESSKISPGNLTFSIFYETFLTTPFRYSYFLGLRCGYFFPL